MSDNDSVIVDALKVETEDIRITNGNKWLYWREATCGYVVLQHKYSAKKTTTVCETADFAEAMKALTE